jgi:hypothetical protein
MVVLLLSRSASGGVRRLGSNLPSKPADPVDPHASAGLFVGVHDFTKDSDLTPVKYAVDDAVDLAYELSIDHHPPLLNPDRIVLALSGEPQKPESVTKLQALLSAGAMRHTAEQSDIFTLLEAQSGLIGRNGILVVAFATHGISEEGTQYLLVASSLLKYRETMVTEAKVCDIVASHGALRSLILIDACRERLTRDRRNGEPDPRSVAASGNAMGSVEGQAVLSAAAAGDYAYDDDKRQNGVFSAAVIDGLRCGASTDARGFVTVETLWSYVQEQVLEWIQTYKNPGARRATALQCDGFFRTLPLAFCPNHTVAGSSTGQP